MSQWSADFKAQTGNTVIYGGGGSGAGITQISNRTVDFGASDAPLTPRQAATCNNCVQIPWALTRRRDGVNLPGVSAPDADATAGRGDLPWADHELV